MITINLFGQQENIEPRKFDSWNSGTKISAIWRPTQLKPNQFEHLRRRFEDKERIQVRTCLHFSYRRDRRNQVGLINFPFDLMKTVRDSFPIC